MDFSATAPVFIPILLTTGAVGAVLAGIWLVRLPAIALWLLGVSLIAGQLIRVPFPGQGGGLLLSDLAVVGILSAAAVRGRYRLPGHHVRIIAFSCLPFLAWAIGSLVLNPLSLAVREFVIAASYWARLAAYLLATPALIMLIEYRPAYHQLLRHIFVATITAIVALGYVQLWVMPELASLGSGWDPHQYRFVSTWLDPNFIGMFLVVAFVWLGSQLDIKKQGMLFYLFLMVVTLGGILLTQSRSTLVAAVAAGIVIIPWFIISYLARLQPAQKIIFSCAMVTLGVISSVAGGVLLSERFTNLLNGTDPTVAIRSHALQRVWELVQEHGWLGVGYNAYQFAALRIGLIGDFAIHSRAGADNSWLTIWVTTGIIGLILFTGMWVSIAWQLIIHWRQGAGRSAGAASVILLAIAMHSQFVNSLLYVHLLLTTAVVLALALTSPVRRQPTS